MTEVTPGSHRHVVVTLRVPDRPGALGAVASRIGSVGADITDVRVASRRDGTSSQASRTGGAMSRRVKAPRAWVRESAR